MVFVTPRAASNRSIFSSQATSSPLRTRRPPPPRAAEQIAENSAAENVAEGLENVVDIVELMHAPFDAGVTVAVVAGVACLRR